jgi:hypothetical protein
MLGEFTDRGMGTGGDILRQLTDLETVRGVGVTPTAGATPLHPSQKPKVVTCQGITPLNWSNRLRAAGD